MIAMQSSGPEQPRRRPLHLEAGEPRPARVSAAHDEDGGGSGRRRQPAHLEPPDSRSQHGGVKGSKASDRAFGGHGLRQRAGERRERRGGNVGREEAVYGGPAVGGPER